MTHSSFRIKKQCKDCPWRKDAELGKFPLERYEGLATTQEAKGALMACHTTPDGNEGTCVGFLKNQLKIGHNVNVRIAAAFRRFDPGELEVVGEQYGTFCEMVRANYDEYED